MEIKDYPNLLVATSLIKPIDISSKYLCKAKNSLQHNTEQIFVHGVFVLSIASMETMVSDVLRYYLINFPQKLSTAFKFEKDEFFENHFGLLERSIDKYIYALSYESVESYFKKFLKSVSIKWDDFEDSFGKDIQGIKEVRNLLLHNGKAVHESRPRQSKINCDYAVQSIDKIINFEEELKKRINEKYKEYTKINANKKLWQFMFKSPIMAYDNYWHYDEIKDHIYALKKCKYEDGLSSSETMLLELWRSHFHSSQIKYFNMKHLDGATREKALFFLSIAKEFSFE